MKSIEEVIEAFKDFASSSKVQVKKKLRSSIKPFREEVGEFITEIIEEAMFPYFKNYLLRKYSEADFHRKVDENFDLVKDLYENHYDDYMKYLKKAKRIRRFIKWDNERFCSYVIEALKNEGLTIREKDVEWLMRNIEALRKEIYS